MNKKITLGELRKVDPLAFVKLCEKIGNKDEPLKYYAESNNAQDIYHAAKLAFELNKYDFAKNLLKKAREVSEKYLSSIRGDVIGYDHGPREGDGLMGALYSNISRTEIRGEHQELRLKISELEKILGEK